MLGEGCSVGEAEGAAGGARGRTEHPLTAAADLAGHICFSDDVVDVLVDGIKR
ncbi:MAG: hypothetical protein AVDCRST_MAG21-501 [uncultured Nocardioidaceae bacterium]|uniref:Uncharacterized protein n=1 Tax=uncultured Nocardioidaceae bacterium TaxID=253824 RepID=A0A6J4MU47_9ACTN|nr:MAG: hypothetical protein AVDCRST_MAG21-501 [uncultured Nocardioidaceae bacterium]